jgi:acetyl-CoA carboxylase carboxyltransferase component
MNGRPAEHPAEPLDPTAAARQATLAPSERAAAKLASQHKLYVRDRIDLLFDEGSFVEDGQLANALAPGLPADGVVTGQGLVDGRPALVVANDPTVKAGSWGARTVEKIVRITERALVEELPVFWLIDSAGARITDQVALFPGRRGAGRIFHNQVALSGKVPQICCLFGPSAAGGAYIPSFCDVVIMVEENASMYLGSPRMAEMVVGEHVSLQEMGGARMHATVSGCGDNLADDDADAIEQARLFLSYLPTCWRESPPEVDGAVPAHELADDVVPETESVPFDMHLIIDGIVDADSFFEVKPLFAAEVITGFARIEGQSGRRCGQQLCGARRCALCRLRGQGRPVHLDVRRVQCAVGLSGRRARFHDRQRRRAAGHHPPRAKMITAVAEATVPQISVIVRKAYGAGLYAMAGPGFMPDACLALPTAKIAVMGPEAAVNAVYAAKIAEIADPAERVQFVSERRTEYEEDVDLLRLAADLVIDAIITPAELRGQLAARLAVLAGKSRHFAAQAPRDPSDMNTRPNRSVRSTPRFRGTWPAERLPIDRRARKT